MEQQCICAGTKTDFGCYVLLLHRPILLQLINNGVIFTPFFVIPSQCYLLKRFHPEQDKGRKQTVSYAVKKDDLLPWNLSSKNPQIVQHIWHSKKLLWTVSAIPFRTLPLFSWEQLNKKFLAGVNSHRTSRNLGAVSENTKGGLWACWFFFFLLGVLGFFF